MAEYVNKEEALERCGALPKLYREAMRLFIKEMPSVNIVRCKECKHRGTCCRPCYKSADSYCSDGEREDKPQTCEECEHWSDTEDGCADRHGCKTEPNLSEIPNGSDEPQIVGKHADVIIIDEPQTERKE